MLGKGNKKDLCRWRFDTSSDNLECFIGKKAKRSNDSSPCERVARLIRKRGRPSKGKPVRFQNQAFLESILANTFSEEFAGSQDIKELVKKLKLSEDEENSPDERTKARNKQLGLAPHKSEQQLSSLDEYKLFVGERSFSPPAKEGVSSTRVCTQETPERSDLREQTSTSSFQMEDYNYDFPYYNQESDYYKYQEQYSREQYAQSTDRRRRYANSDESGDYRINLEHIQEDGRTTLMVRNIPNKYTQQLLLEELNRHFKVKFDFFYLPIDYNNACNVGYAFINFIHAKFIPAFYHEFNGKKWSRFNSEKICSLTYARIQGTGALRSHFKNSHVMQQKDKRLRPLLNEMGEEQRSNLSKIVQGQQEKM